MVVLFDEPATALVAESIAEADDEMMMGTSPWQYQTSLAQLMLWKSSRIPTMSMAPLKVSLAEGLIQLKELRKAYVQAHWIVDIEDSYTKGRGDSGEGHKKGKVARVSEKEKKKWYYHTHWFLTCLHSDTLVSCGSAEVGRKNKAVIHFDKKRRIRYVSDKGKRFKFGELDAEAVAQYMLRP
ncbi:hypothetical protein Tco_0501016 [Tanacetum coccineum]